MSDDKKKDVPFETIIKLKNKYQQRGGDDTSDQEKHLNFQKHLNNRGDFEDDGGKKKGRGR